MRTELRRSCLTDIGLTGGYLSYQRRDARHRSLAIRASFSASLWWSLGYLAGLLRPATDGFTVLGKSAAAAKTSFCVVLLRNRSIALRS